MRSAAYKARFVCKLAHQRSVTVTQITRLGSARITGAKIDEKFRSSNGTDVVVIVASVRSHTIKGAFREAYVSRAGYSCDSGIVYFALKR